MAESKTNGAVDPFKTKPELEPIQTGGDYPEVPNTYSPQESPSALLRGNLYDEVIPDPEEVHHRNLVLCFDGTGDQFDADVST
jgi:hypothetical protein